jgi:hypothetical protein
MSRGLFLNILLLTPQVALAEVFEHCEDLDKPDDYDETVQQDFLQNFPALVSSFSAIHAPIPHAPGHGMIGINLSGVPYLSCEQQYVLGWTKTEDTNRTPVIPLPRISFAFPVSGSSKLVPYGGVGYLPPVTLMETRTVILSAELGLGYDFDGPLSAGLRGHATSMKIVADVASHFSPEDPDVVDLFIGHTFGVDAMVGYDTPNFTPYLAVGFTDVSTFFYIGDTGVVTDNRHPYFGLTTSAGVDMLLAEKWRLGGELYYAPGGYSLPDPNISSVEKASRYGNLFTARMRFGREF